MKILWAEQLEQLSFLPSYDARGFGTEILELQLLRLDSSWASALEAVSKDGNDLEQLESLQGDRLGGFGGWGLTGCFLCSYLFLTAINQSFAQDVNTYHSIRSRVILVQGHCDGSGEIEWMCFEASQKSPHLSPWINMKST